MEITSQNETPPGITKPEGEIFSTDPPAVSGRVVKISDESITIMVENVKWKMDLSEQAQKEKARFAELDMPIQKDDYVIAYYDLDQEQDKRTVTRLEILHVN